MCNKGYMCMVPNKEYMCMAHYYLLTMHMHYYIPTPLCRAWWRCCSSNGDVCGHICLIPTGSCELPASVTCGAELSRAFTIDHPSRGYRSCAASGICVLRYCYKTTG